jgi:hypothetical protein
MIRIGKGSVYAVNLEKLTWSVVLLEQEGGSTVLLAIDDIPEIIKALQYMAQEGTKVLSPDLEPNLYQSPESTLSRDLL